MEIIMYWRRWIILITTTFNLTGVTAFTADFRKIRSTFVCENAVMHLNCTPPKLLEIHGADFGAAAVSVCGGKGKGANVSCDVIDRTEKVKFACDNKPSCSLVAMARVFGDSCPSSSKYLNVMHACVRPLNAVTTPQFAIATTEGVTESSSSVLNRIISSNTTKPPSTEPSRKNALTTRPVPEGVKTMKVIPTFDPSSNFALEAIYDSAEQVKWNALGIFLFVFIIFAISV